jgi:hypothetical protein
LRKKPIDFQQIFVSATQFDFNCPPQAPTSPKNKFDFALGFHYLCPFALATPRKNKMQVEGGIIENGKWKRNMGKSDIIIGYEISGYDNDSYMMGSCDKLFPELADIPKCKKCGYRTDYRCTNKDFVLKRKKKIFASNAGSLKVFACQS